MQSLFVLNNMKIFIKFLVRGVIFVTPIGLTILLIISFLNWLSNKVDQADLHWWVLLVILVVSAGLLAVVGYLGSTYIVKPITNAVEGVINKIPVIKFIYSSIKDVMSAFVGDKRKFDQPVLVSFPSDDIYKPGFITQHDLGVIGMPGSVAVYLPHSYAFSGVVFIVDKSRVKSVDIPSSEMMKFILSGGVAFHDDEEL